MSSASSSLEQGMTNASITGEQKEESNPVATSTSTTTAADSTDPASANDSNPDTTSDNNNIDSSSSDDTSTTSSGGDGDDNGDANDDDDDNDNDNDDNNDTPISTSDNNEDDVDPMTLITKAITHKEDGNNQFKNKEFTKASRSYKKGVNTMKQLLKKSDTNPDDEQIKSLRLSLQSNLCMVYYKLEKYKNCTEIADYILTNLDSKNSKAYYRRGLSNYKLNKISNAKHDLYQALQYNPKDKFIIKEYRMVKKEYDTKISKQKKDKEKQKKALAKAFSSGGGNGSGESSSLYDDKEEELKKKRLKAEEERLEKEKLKEKRKADWEEDCVKRLSENVEVLPFEEYDKFMTETEEKEKKSSKKAKKEQEEAEHRRRQKEIEEKNRKNRENAKKNNSDDEEGSDDDILTESELKQLRGYKKTSDGRTTSYFSREQTEHEKKLLGSIAPKKLEPATVSATNQPSSISSIKTNVPPRQLDSSMSSSSASAWNQAGTWEEKDTSSWCNKTLEKFLKDTNATYESESISFDACVNKVENLTGDASVANVSGKKRFIFDYSTDLTYEISMKSSTDMDVDADEQKNVVIAKGSLHLPDISSTSISDEEIDVQVMAWKKDPKDVYKVNATKCREVLVEKIREQVFAFVHAFNSQY